ncbi:MAG: endonuclease [Alphaproteobacteria bacterium]|nr:endonuclease [Alphaproteobacteria bacterium]
MAQRYTAAFWNLENLFAPEGYLDREPWIAQRMANDLKGWTQALFDRKLDQLTSIIRQIDGGRGPAVLAVCEVENAYALQHLAQRISITLGRPYAVVHADAARDKRGIDTAFLYDTAALGFVDGSLFSHWVMRSTGTRDISQATFRTASGNDLIVMANHWPSRSGGAHESRGYRMVAGETLGYWHRRIWETVGNDAAILAMGDLNDDPFDESVSIHARATRERSDVVRATTAPQFYNLTWNYLEQQSADLTSKTRTLHGTLYYKGDANIFDQILASRGLIKRGLPLRVLEDTARIEAFPEMIDTKVSPGPIRFGLPKGAAATNIDQNGFSDHYPVSVVIEER